MIDLILGGVDKMVDRVMALKRAGNEPMTC
jgi:hypothetical protein